MVKKLLSINSNNYNYDKKHINLYKCQLDKCYKETSEYLEYLNKYMNTIEIKKQKYNIDDYINTITAIIKYQNKNKYNYLLFNNNYIYL